MEKWQKRYIIQNLPDLQHQIIYSDELISVFLSKQILSTNDVEKMRLAKYEGNLEGTTALLNILQTRLNGYEVLTKALYETNQTGAFQILLQGFEQNSVQSAFEICNIHLDLENLLEKHFLFQGEIFSFRQLCEWIGVDNFKKVISNSLNVDDFFKLHDCNNNEVVISIMENTIPDPIPYYINRQVSIRRYLDSDIFKSKCSDIFIIKGLLRHELSKLAGPFERTSRSSLQRDKVSVRFILWESDYDVDLIFSRAKFPVHFVIFETEKYKLIKTFGGMLNINKYLQTSLITLSEEKFIASILTKEFKYFCICDSPGIGKSIFLANIANRVKLLDKDFVVIFLQFSKLCIEFNDLSAFEATNDAFISILNSITQLVSASSFRQKCLMEIIKNRNKHLLLCLDGFDEVQENQVSSAVKILDILIRSTTSDKIKLQLLVTTRTHYDLEVEAIFGMPSAQLAPFSYRDQIECLLLYWESKLKVQRNSTCFQFATTCINLLNQNDNESSDKNITGIPLKCGLLAEIYEIEAKKYFETTTLWKMTTINSNSVVNAKSENLIQLFIKLKEQRFEGISYNKFQDIINVHYYTAIEELYRDWIDSLQKYVPSVYIVSSPQILSVGLIEKHGNTYRFIHRMVAEYFLADFLVSLKLDKPEKANNYFEFLFNQILITRKASCSVLTDLLNDPETPVVYHRINSFNFINSKLCFFINELLEKSEIDLNRAIYLPVLNVSLIDSLMLFQIMHSCLHYDLFEILNIIRHKFTDMQRSCMRPEKNNIPWVTLFLIAVKYSNVETLIACLDLLEVVVSDFSTSIFHLGKPSPLQIAMERGCFEIVEEICKHSILVISNYNIPVDQQLLHYCVSNSSENKDEVISDKIAMLNFIIDQGNINEILNELDERLCTPILLCNIHIKLLLHLITLGADITLETYWEETLLHKASYYLSPENFHKLVVQPEIACLLKYKFNSRDYLGRTIIQVAIRNIDLSNETLRIFAALCEFDVNERDAENRTLLALAVQFGRSKCVLKELVRLGGEVRNKWIPNLLETYSDIHFAIKYDNVEAVEFFIEKGFETNLSYAGKYTPVKFAIQLHQVNCVEILETLKHHGATFDNEDERNVSNVLLMSYNFDEVSYLDKIETSEKQGLPKISDLRLKLVDKCETLAINDNTADNQLKYLQKKKQS